MKWILTITILAGLSSVPACAKDNTGDLVNFFKNDFTTFMASDWTEYSVKEYFSKNPKNYDYLSATFNNSIVQQSSSISDAEVNVQESRDSEGGYDLGIIRLQYSDSNTASRINSVIENNKVKNLKGGKIFIGYTSKQCGNNVVLLYSSAVLTDKIKAYFSHIKNINC